MLIINVAVLFFSIPIVVGTWQHATPINHNPKGVSKVLNSQKVGPTALQLPNLFGLNVLKHDISVGYQKIQTHLSNNDEDCFPGSLAYNGSCIYFSSRNQRLSWVKAKQFCESLPLNTSFLVIETEDEFEFLRKSLVKFKLDENPVDQLVFLVGFSNVKSKWKWINNMSLESSNLKLDSHWNDFNNPIGDCGSIALTKNFGLIMKSSPCENLKTRFICKYKLNQCYKNNMCGTKGKCINMYESFYCDCEAISIFYTGKYCDKFLLSIYIIAQTKHAKKIIQLIRSKFSKQFQQDINSEVIEKKEELPIEIVVPEPDNKPKTYFSKDISRSSTITRPLRSISRIIESKKVKVLHFFLNSNIYGYILLVFMVILLTIIQIVLIDFNSLELFNLKNRIKRESPFVTYLCTHLERNYYTEEIIYLVFATLFFLLLIFKQKKRRFTNYIMKKFRKHSDILEAPTEVKGLNKKFDSLFTFIPSFSFSTSNRSQAAAVYIIYTYDVLNIFIFIYASDMTTSLFPLTSDFAGVLFDFFKQILQVLLIGVKFYPILIVADLDPSIIIYFATSFYISIIWFIRFINKAFCSHTKAYIEVALSQLIGGLNKRLDRNIQSYKNSNLTGFQGFFKAEISRPDEKYLTAIKTIYPKIFAQTFKHMNNDGLINPTTKRIFLKEASIINKFNTIHRYAENEFIYKWIGLLQNLPFYITISYLLTRYGLLFTASLVDRLKDISTHKKKLARNFPDLTFNPDCKESAKNLNDIIDSPEDDNNSLTFSKHIFDETEVNDTNILSDSLYIIKNSNYRYILNLLNKKKQNLKSGNRTDKSFLYHFFEQIISYIYRTVPFMKFSKQIINTYVVAFMIVYFFTLFGIRLANLFNDLLVKCVELASQYIYGISSVVSRAQKLSLIQEIRFTCIATSFVIIIQLFLSIKSFQHDLVKLHKAENVFGSLINNYDFKKYAKIIKRRNRMSSEITSDSIHFPGYLIAHLVYGYLVLFAGLFSMLLVVKFCYIHPNIIYSLSQIVLPLVIMMILKLIIVQFMTKFIFLKHDSYRISRSIPYHTIAYFNFFFDCFLGLVACMSRVWLTNFISLLTLTRLDVSVFNKDGIFFIRRLDKGYLAYINYVRMEHWYNNPVVNGFCEMIIESMLNSKIKRKQIEEPIIGSNTMRLIRLRSQSQGDAKCSLFEKEILSERLIKKNLNPEFKFKSYLVLRNMFYVLILLKNIPFLRQHRWHFERLAAPKSDKNESFFDSFDRQKRKFNKSKMTKQMSRLYSKEAQLYDILKSKNDLIIQQNLTKIMESNNDSAKIMMDVKTKSARNVFFADIVDQINEEDAAMSGKQDRKEYNLKKTRFS